MVKEHETLLSILNITIVILCKFKQVYGVFKRVCINLCFQLDPFIFKLKREIL